MSRKNPQWLELSNSLLWPLVGMSLTSVGLTKSSDPDTAMMPYSAGCHFASCIETAQIANEKGNHSVAIALIRQSLEALTIVELGLLPPSFSELIIRKWKSGKYTQGKIRSILEEEIWSSYGSGLWDEPWSDFMGNLARSVQSYAHYSSDLQGWQDVVIDSNGDGQAVIQVGLMTYDPIKASRITLLHSILCYVLGRLQLNQNLNPEVMLRESAILELGTLLGKSKLLFTKKDWGVQLRPHMYFKPGYDWIDE